MRGQYIVFAALGAGLLFLVLNHDKGTTFGIDNDDFGRMIYLIPIAGLLGAGILSGHRGSLGNAVRQLAIWLVIILALVAVWLYRDDMRRVGERVMAGLMPGRAVVVTTSEGGSEIILHKSMNGHFQANVAINGRTIGMMVDTGASSVVLTGDDARAIGIAPETLDFSVTVMTANGRTTAAPVMLQDIAIGPISRSNISAIVAADGSLEQSLLGMSFLSTLGSLQMQTDELRLRD